MESSLPISAASICPECGSQIATSLLACPGCERLVHADRLRALADAATNAANAGNLTLALTHWREAMELLPPGSRQFQIIREKAAALSRQIDELSPAARAALTTTAPAGPAASSESGSKSSPKTLGAAILGGAMLLLSKGKLLLAGLLKGGTLLSMLASMSIYWTAFGWKFAVGLVVSIYIHEMGHVAMLHRYGIKASAPLFIPGVGAIVRLRQHLATPSEDARVGLAGPMWGLGAAVGAWLGSLIGSWPAWAAIAQVGAWINLFNLMPVWQLDGGRAFNAMTKAQRGLALIAILLAWAWVQDGLLLLLAIMAIGRTFSANAPDRPDRRALWEYVFLIAALSAMVRLLVPASSLAP